MERYTIKNNAPVSPPRGGVTADGRVISNFAARVRNDADFAKANGYYPIREQQGETSELLEEAVAVKQARYVLEGEEWVRKLDS